MSFKTKYKDEAFVAKLATAMGVEAIQAKYFAEMICTGKVKNVPMVYKKTVGMLSKLKKKTSFTFIEGAKGNFLYVGSFEFMNKAAVMAAGAKAEDNEVKEFFKEFKKVAAKFTFTTGQFKLKEHKKDSQEAVMSIEKIKGSKGVEALASVLNASNEFIDSKKTKFRLHSTAVVGESSDQAPKTEETTKKEETVDKTSSKEETVDKQALEAKKTKRLAKVSKMNENVGKLTKAKAAGKIENGAIQGNLDKYETMLAALIKEAEEDGVVDDTEKGKIDELTGAIDELKKLMAEGGSKKKLTPERRAKIKENMGKISAKLEQITKKLGLA